MKRTKIVCTLGPSTEDEDSLQGMLELGMDAARLNMSHGNRSQHQTLIHKVRKLAKGRDVALAVIADTQGPEVRIGWLKDTIIQVQKGEIITLVEGEFVGDGDKVPLNYSGIAASLKSGDRMLIGDGEIELEVREIRGQRIECVAKNTGNLRENKGIHIRGASLNIPAITEKDREDIKFAVDMDVDFIALSFVREDKDVHEARDILEENGGEGIEIIAKIESNQAWKNIDGILEAADGIMVARGDLGLELNPEDVPATQKQLINKANISGRTVITATQMLESMTGSPRPTRAEVTDVANAILDGTDAVMLSGETAIGNYPLEAVDMMARIARRTEELLKEYSGRMAYPIVENVAEAIGQSACEIADNLKAAGIITSTRSGYTAKIVSKFRPGVRVIAVTPTDKVFNKLALLWGVIPLKIPFSTDTDSMIENSMKAAVKAGMFSVGDTVVITAGVPFGIEGLTNLIEVQEVKSFNS